MDIAAWLRGLGLARYEAAFRENEIDWALLPKLTADDLKDLGIGLVGHRRKLLEAIAQLSAADVPPHPIPPTAPSGVNLFPTPGTPLPAAQPGAPAHPGEASFASSPPNLCAPIHLAADYITITGQWLLQRFLRGRVSPNLLQPTAAVKL
jgi:hypothetical protein